MRYVAPLRPGTLLRRYKRFLADVLLDDGRTVTAHCPDPGRMRGLIEGAPRVHLRHDPSPHRKLAWALELLEAAGTLVCVNTLRANGLLVEALDAGRIGPLAGYTSRRREVVQPDGSRLDLLLRGPAGDCLVEVKSVTMADAGIAGFPDSVTRRGLRHLESLRAARLGGLRTVLVFWVGRSDCRLVRPADAIDPDYGRALRRAVAEGLELVAIGARVGLEGIEAGEILPVDLAPALGEQDAHRVVVRPAAAPAQDQMSVGVAPGLEHGDGPGGGDARSTSCQSGRDVDEK